MQNSKAHGLSGLFGRLGGFHRGKLATAVTSSKKHEVRSSSPPIDAYDALDDCSLIIGGLLEELSEIIEVTLDTSLTYQMYQAVESGDERFDFEHCEDEYRQMAYWVKQKHLPHQFRQTLVQLFIATDGLQERVSLLSQGRYKRLNAWSNVRE